jgi:hypothetical protein
VGISACEAGANQELDFELAEGDAAAEAAAKDIGAWAAEQAATLRLTSRLPEDTCEEASLLALALGRKSGAPRIELSGGGISACDAGAKEELDFELADGDAAVKVLVEGAQRLDEEELQDTCECRSACEAGAQREIPLNLKVLVERAQRLDEEELQETCEWCSACEEADNGEFDLERAEGGTAVEGLVVLAPRHENEELQNIIARCRTGDISECEQAASWEFDIELAEGVTAVEGLVEPASRHEHEELQDICACEEAAKRELDFELAEGSAAVEVLVGLAPRQDGELVESAAGVGGGHWGLCAGGEAAKRELDIELAEAFAAVDALVGFAPRQEEAQVESAAGVGAAAAGFGGKHARRRRSRRHACAADEAALEDAFAAALEVRAGALRDHDAAITLLREGAFLQRLFCPEEHRFEAVLGESGAVCNVCRKSAALLPAVQCIGKGCAFTVCLACTQAVGEVPELGGKIVYDRSSRGWQMLWS